MNTQAPYHTGRRTELYNDCDGYALVLVKLDALYGRPWWEDRDNYEKFEYMKAVKTLAFVSTL